MGGQDKRRKRKGDNVSQREDADSEGAVKGRAPQWGAWEDPQSPPGEGVALDISMQRRLSSRCSHAGPARGSPLFPL